MNCRHGYAKAACPACKPRAVKKRVKAAAKWHMIHEPKMLNAALNTKYKLTLDYYGYTHMFKNGKAVFRVWKPGRWYSICLKCFLRFGKHGAYTGSISNYTCPICDKEHGCVDFYPYATHPDEVKK